MSMKSGNFESEIHMNMIMKRTIIIAVLVALVGAASANAQEDNQLFNHLGVGVTLGVDGMGLQVAAPVMPMLQVRAGYAFNTPAPGTGSFGTHTMDNGHPVNLDNMPMTVWSYKGGLGELFVDFFPEKTGIFRISAGMFAGGGKFLSVKADMRETMAKEDYATMMSSGDVKFSTDAEGYGYGDALTWKVLPYVGIGTGRAVNLQKEKHKLTFTFDLGVAFTSGIKIQTYEFTTGSKVPCAVTSAATVDEAGKQQDGGLIDALSGIPVLPVLKFGLFYRLF